MLTKTQDSALALMAVMVKREALYEEVNDKLRSLDCDFPSRIQFIDCDIWQPIMDLLDAASGDTITSYFMNEGRAMKDGGACIEPDGKRWPIKTLDDVRAYLEHINVLQTETE